MNSLKTVDLVALSKVDEKTKMLDLSSNEIIIDPQSRVRLIGAGLVGLDGFVSAAGMKVVSSIRAKDAELRKGIPFSLRKNSDPRRLFKETPSPWLFAMMGKDQIVTNGELLFVGKPELQMNATRGSDDLKKDLPEIVRQCGIGPLQEVWPHSYQAFSFGGIDLVWLSNESQDLMVSIQAKYHDFVKWRFPKSEFWANNPDIPVQAKVKGKGVKGSVVAILATFEVAGELEIPKKIEGWLKDGKEMSADGMSSLQERNRGPIREGKEE